MNIRNSRVGKINTEIDFSHGVEQPPKQTILPAINLPIDMLRLNTFGIFDTLDSWRGTNPDRRLPSTCRPRAS